VSLTMFRIRSRWVGDMARLCRRRGRARRSFMDALETGYVGAKDVV